MDLVAILKNTAKQIASLAAMPTEEELYPALTSAAPEPTRSLRAKAISLVGENENITASIAAFRDPLFNISKFTHASSIQTHEFDPARAHRDRLLDDIASEVFVFESQGDGEKKQVVFHVPLDAHHLREVTVELFEGNKVAGYAFIVEATLERMAQNADEARPILELIPDFNYLDIANAAKSDAVARGYSSEWNGNVRTYLPEYIL